MKIGFVGLGKLGYPVALAVESMGHEVMGFDVSLEVVESIKNKTWPHTEAGMPELMAQSKLKLGNMEEVIQWADIVFCAVQTPHEPEFEGSTPIPVERRDFNYSFIRLAVRGVAVKAERLKKQTTLVVISTCLPGTYDREIKPLLNEYIDYVYNPFFIAMGQVVGDFLNPEFVLLGQEGVGTPLIIENFYASIHKKPLLWTDIKTAEAIKVFYNSFITMKTVFANAVGEFAQKIGANFDDIFKSWELSTDRLISTKYLQAGMGDGGGCHPRDNIALSYLSTQIGMSHNIWEDLMSAREDHARFLADSLMNVAVNEGLPIIILGRSFKPETNIETGSPALLVSSLIDIPHKHVEDLQKLPIGIYLIGTKHARYADYQFPEGSLVIDPFRYIADQKGVAVIRIGDNIKTKDKTKNA